MVEIIRPLSIALIATAPARRWHTNLVSALQRAGHSVTQRVEAPGQERRYARCRTSARTGEVCLRRSLAGVCAPGTALRCGARQCRPHDRPARRSAGRAQGFMPRAVVRRRAGRGRADSGADRSKSAADQHCPLGRRADACCARDAGTGRQKRPRARSRSSAGAERGPAGCVRRQDRARRGTDGDARFTGAARIIPRSHPSQRRTSPQKSLRA